MISSQRAFSYAAGLLLVLLSVLIVIGILRLVQPTGMTQYAGTERDAPVPTDKIQGSAGKFETPAEASSSVSSGTFVPRSIAPQLVPAPRVEIASLQRETTLDPAGRQGPAVPEEWQYELLHQPVVIASNRIEAAGYRIVIAGVNALQPDRQCVVQDGTRKTCPVLARTALRAWIRGRSVECRVPSRPDRNEIVTDCTLAGRDIATWIVRNGWAEPEMLEHLLVELDRAQATGRGIFRR